MKRLQIPIEYKTLKNGLGVVTAPDPAAPVVTLGVYYKIGFRLEPQGRSGFAHLFEHMMFQGSENAAKMQHIKLINSSGGVLNGSTMYDVTNYYEAVPSNALERVLWLEADRMRALKVDDENLKNQRDVVKEEVRVNVRTSRMGDFPGWTCRRWRFATGRIPIIFMGISPIWMLRVSRMCRVFSGPTICRIMRCCCSWEM